MYCLMALPLARPLGRLLARYLSQPAQRGVRVATCSLKALTHALRKGDVLLVEGNSRFSIAIKYLTQSTWSHAALCVADAASGLHDEPMLLEADVIEGIRLSPLSRYRCAHTRICRPVGLPPESIDSVIQHAMARVGQQYDLKNVFDLARYLIQKPPVPNHWRRRLLAIGSGDPTRAICSSLIAQAYQTIKYPILPVFTFDKAYEGQGRIVYEERAHIRHHSLYAPGDFDLSPYFQVVKPTIENGFDPAGFAWGDDSAEMLPPNLLELSEESPAPSGR